MFGFSSDFYWVDGQSVRTPWSLAIEEAFSSGWGGKTPRIHRHNTMTSGEVGQAWAKDAIKNWANTVGDTGVLCPVVADETYLQDDNDNTLPIAHVQTVVDGIALASATPEIWVQVGNEPYIGATGQHCILNQSYATNAIALAQAIKSAFPQVKTIAPPIGTFRSATVALCDADLRSNWASYCHYFKGHGGAFDYVAGNLYRWNVVTNPPDNTNKGVRKNRKVLEASALLLGLTPVITEVGLLTPTEASLNALLTVTGKRIPAILWKVGPGDSYDMIASGAISPPA